jgi:kexin
MRADLWHVSFTLLCLAVLGGCGGDGSLPPDPLTSQQWHLGVAAENKGFAHANVPLGWSGNGVLVAVVDNGIDINHEDLASNIGQGSYSYIAENFDFTDADHGTAVAGLIAATDYNGRGGRGVAPGAKVIGFNVLRAPSMSNFADALTQHKDRVSVSNNSWGDFNSWGEPLALRTLVEAALEDGTSKGRNGKGVVYVFSAGNGDTANGGLPSDNVNYSGLVNNRYTIPVCANDEFGKKASYSETGATLIVCAPSKGSSGLGIVTTDTSGDKGYNPEYFKSDLVDVAYTRNFGGTSASAPIVSGVVALMLEANPNLSWRDVKAILAASAQRNDPNDADWTTNSAGLHINHRYGFGLVDAGRAVELAQVWQPFGLAEATTYGLQVNQDIPDDDPQGIQSAIEVTEDMTVEFVDIYFDAPDHNRLGDLEVVLISPSGTRSVLAERHEQSFEVFRYRNWRFGSARHLLEHSRGRWLLLVKDKRTGETATWVSWKLKIHGHYVAAM